MIKLHFNGKKTKLTEDAASLVAEIASLAVVEATLRAGKQAKTEGSSVISPEHLEKVLPQLVSKPLNRNYVGFPH